VRPPFSTFNNLFRFVGYSRQPICIFISPPCLRPFLPSLSIRGHESSCGCETRQSTALSVNCWHKRIFTAPLPFLRRLVHALTHRHHTGNSGPRRPPRQSPTKQVTGVVHRLFRPSIRRRGLLPRPSRISCTTPLNSLARLRSVMC
jgi:hypothetical protein